MIDKAKVEILKVWYSIFCVLIDDNIEIGIKMSKLATLREILKHSSPGFEVENQLQMQKLDKLDLFKEIKH